MLSNTRIPIVIVLALVVALANLVLIQPQPVSADGPSVEGFAQDPITGVVEAPYVVNGITYTQDQATGDFAGLLYTAEDSGTLYFAFAQSVFINDNTYGANSIGWGKRGHRLKDLLNSEHIKVQLFNNDGTLIYDFFIDYASDVGATKGKKFIGPVESLGVTGGDGSIAAGDPSTVDTDSSLAWNWINNQTDPDDVNSPARIVTNTYDLGTTADPNDVWIYETVYEWSVPVSAFGASGYGGGITISEVHNSPVKSGNPVPVPVITVSKTSDPASGSDVLGGQSILYTVTASNSGALALTDVVISDVIDTNLTNVVLDGGSYDGGSRTVTWPSIPVFSPGDAVSVQFQADVIVATAVGTQIFNTGKISSPDLPTDVFTNTTVHNVVGGPAIELIKSGSLDLGADGIANPGDVISYTFTVTNTGNVTLSGVTVTVPLLTVSGGPITLAPGASDSTTFTGTYAITQADIDAGERDNLATAIGSPPAGGPVSDDDPHNEPVPAAPSIELIKSGSLDLGADGIANPGDVISYTFTVTNTGNVTLSGVTVTVPLLTVSGGPITLAPGASDSTTFTGTYAITQADIDAGERDNLATAIGSPPAGGPVSDDDPHNEPVPAAPSIELIKSGSLDLGADGIANPGDVISYTFTVTNTGNVTLSGVTVTDPLLTVSGGPITLAPGASDSTTFTGTYTITQADIDAGERDNLATAIGSPPAGGPVSDDDPHNEPIPAPPPDVTVSKTAVSATIVVGEEAIFSITVTNDGPGAAVGVTLTDNLPAVSGTWILGGTDAADCLIAVDGTSLTCSFGDLGSGASKSFNVSTVTDSADCDPASNSFSLPNTATVAATNEPASATGNNSDSDTITVSCPGALFIILDEDAIDNDNPPYLTDPDGDGVFQKVNHFKKRQVNDDVAEVGVRAQLRYFASNGCGGKQHECPF